MLGYLADVESDFSVFHRVDDIGEMEAARFFRLALRLTAYEGVLTARRLAEQERDGGSMDAGQAKEVAGTRSSVLSDPALGSVVSWGGAG